MAEFENSCNGNSNCNPINSLIIVGIKCSVLDSENQVDESLVIWNVSEGRSLWIDKYDVRAIIENKDTLQRGS